MPIKFIVPKPDAPIKPDKETVDNLVDSVDKLPKLDKVKDKDKKPPKPERVKTVTPQQIEIPLPEGFKPSKNEEPQETPHAPKSSSRKSSRKTSTTKSDGKSLTAEQLAKHVKGFHAFLDVIFPGFALEDYEAEQMGIALKDVMDAYDMKPSPKVASLIALGATVAIVELPKIKLITLQTKQKKQMELAKQQAMKINKQQVSVGEPMVDKADNTLTLVTTRAVAVGEPMK